MGLEVVTVSGREPWDRLASEFEGSSVFHRWGWLEAAARASRTRLTKVVVSLDGEPEIAMPIFSRRFGPMAAVFSPPPGLGIEYLGPAFSVENPSAEVTMPKVVEALLDWVAVEFRPSFFYTRTVPLMRDARPFSWSGHDVRPLYTYTLPLADGIDRLFASFDRKLRSDINRTSAKVEVRCGGPELSSRVQQFVSARYHSQHRKFTLTAGYLRDLCENLGPAVVQPVGAYVASGLEAAAIVTFHRGRAAYWQGAARAGGPRLPLTDHLVWFAIQLANERGCQEFELVGANTLRLDPYKMKFRPHLEQFLEISKGTRGGNVAAKLYRRLAR